MSVLASHSGSEPGAGNVTSPLLTDAVDEDGDKQLFDSVVRVPGNDADAETGGETETFRCLICLDDLPYKDASMALRCTHLVCIDCLPMYWTNQVMKESEPFPRCVLRDCEVRASYRELESVLPSDVMGRVRQLQALKPARTTDGQAMFCIRPGCTEALPPPHQPTVNPAQDDDNMEETQNMVSTCPECGTKACLRCGGAEHPREPCASPLPDERQVRLYNSYAAGRVGACPRCGVHIVRDGGCQQVRCSRCNHLFTFKPFENAQEAADAALDGTPQELLDANEHNDPPTPVGFMFLMLWGTGFSGMPLAMFVGTASTGQWDWFLLVLLPFVLIGVSIFLAAVAGYARFLAIDIFPHFGNIEEIPWWRGAGLLLMGAAFRLFAGFWVFIPQPVRTIYLAPFVVYGVTLLAFTVLHFVFVLVRWLVAYFRGWQQVNEDDQQDIETGQTESYVNRGLVGLR